MQMEEWVKFLLVVLSPIYRSAAFYLVVEITMILSNQDRAIWHVHFELKTNCHGNIYLDSIILKS